ncbi:MAG: hypothetical protein ABW328_11525 [Ilumatobacteraceae bacterium]
MTLSGGFGTRTTSTPLAGPGDVVGLDPRAIVRMTPKPEASNVEPNYLVAVDFDEPDLPWMLTPSAADAQGRLRPWLALVVVEDREGVSISIPRGAPLPRLHIEDGASAELGDLTGSWAWAHTQLLVAEGSGPGGAAAMQSDPDRHVSRLLCPRRLRSGARWFACLVPAFDAGVARGLGLPPPDTDLEPAWTSEDKVTLPLYFHWSFSTGPAGDFESLARGLQPFVVGEGTDGTPLAGTVKMHIGAAGGPVDLPDNDANRIVEMDGALRAVQQSDGTLAEIPTAFAQPLAELLDAIADPSGSDPDDGAVGPPLYGAWAANRFKVSDSVGWFRELNLDPRTRVAAGLGTEVVRREQDDLLTACWSQVGAVLQANALLARATLSIKASARFHSRSIARLAPASTLTYAAPLTARAPMGDATADGVTVRAAMTPTSLPDASVDPALRRMLAPTSRFVRKTAAGTGPAPAVSSVSVASSLVGKLAAGLDTVDPTDFVPAGVRPPGQTPPPPPPPPERLSLMGDVRAVGLITSRHVDVLRRSGDLLMAVVREVDPLLQLRQVAAAQPAPTDGFVLQSMGIGGGIRIEAINRVATAEPTATVPPLVTDGEVLGRFEAALANVTTVTTLVDAPPTRTLVPFALAGAATALTERCNPSVAHTARVDAMVRFGSTGLGDLRAGASSAGLDVAPQFDRIMAYPELAIPAYRLLARYDRTRLLPGADVIPPDSVTLLETNPRFIAAFLAGLNHELNRELLWRRYPTDQRGTPVSRFWQRLGNDTDIAPMHQWRPFERSLTDLAGGQANLVLLVRGELLRRHPNTVILAVPASGPTTPSTDDTLIKPAVFAGFIEPDISFFGFDLTQEDLTTGDGWFFAIQEQITEPRFGLDEAPAPDRPAGPVTNWRAAAWTDTDIGPGSPFTIADLGRVATANGLQPNPLDSAMTAEALFQNPVQVLVHARHLVVGPQP